MTRKEEISKQALKYGEPEYLLQAPNILGTQGFVRGAKWADKTMIDKACKWLKMSVEDYVGYDARRGNYYVDTETLINDFKKAMEE